VSTMRAVRMQSYGGPEQLRIEQVPLPMPDLGEVLVRVAAAGVNPVDWKTCAGQGAARFFRNAFPFTPGWDLAGEVVALGEGVTTLKVGEQVCGYIRFPQPGSTFAEYALAPAHQLIVLPPSLDAVQAAALSAVALTAWQTLFDAARLRKGQRVLIHGAAGGVGHLAVQLAKWRGAFVIGTASQANLPVLRELGVDLPLDYARVRIDEFARELDVVLDTIGGATRQRSWLALKPGGVLVSTRSEEFGEVPAQHGVVGRFIWARPDAGQLTRIAALVEAGQVRVIVDRVFPFEQAAEALTYGASGVHRFGKIVLQMY
jgi:NADPH:quinone reductase-like Zn-dependent oxidoreductase